MEELQGTKDIRKNKAVVKYIINKQVEVKKLNLEMQDLVARYMRVMTPSEFIGIIESIKFHIIETFSDKKDDEKRKILEQEVIKVLRDARKEIEKSKRRRKSSKSDDDDDEDEDCDEGGDIPDAVFAEKGHLTVEHTHGGAM